MGKKKSFIDIDDSILNHFSLELGDRHGLLASNEHCSIYVNDDITSWEKIVDKLKSSTYDIDNHSGKKRAFILNRSEVTVDRIKSACKEHSITITNDIDKADLLLTHSAVGSAYRDSDPVRSNELAFKLWNYDTTTYSDNGCSLSKKINDLGEDGIPTIVDVELKNALSHDFEYGSTLLEGWCLTGLALKMAYLIDTSQLETLSIENVLSASATKSVLDQSLLDSLVAMLKSYDDDDKQMAKKIIPTIDKTKNIHLIWELISEVGWEIDRLTRDKDVKYWYNNGPEEYYHLNPEEMILKLSEDGKTMDKKTFMHFESLCRKEIQISNRELYVFKVKLKKEFRHYYEKNEV